MNNFEFYQVSKTASSQLIFRPGTWSQCQRRCTAWLRWQQLMFRWITPPSQATSRAARKWPSSTSSIPKESGFKFNSTTKTWVLLFNSWVLVSCHFNCQPFAEYVSNVYVKDERDYDDLEEKCQAAIPVRSFFSSRHNSNSTFLSSDKNSLHDAFDQQFSQCSSRAFSIQPSRDRDCSHRQWR